MPAHIRKGLITGAPAFSNGGLALSIGTRATRGIRHAIARRAPNGVNTAGPTIPEVTEYKIRGEILDVLTPDGEPPNPTSNKYVEQIDITTSTVSTTNSFAENTINYLEFSVIVANGKTIGVKFTPGTTTTVESLITKQSENVYIFKMPVVLAELITESEGAISVLYLNDTTVSDTESAPDADVELNLSGFGYGETFDLASFKTDFDAYVSEKEYTITMTSDRTLKVKSANLTEVPLALTPLPD